MTQPETKTGYRPCVGIVLLNPQGKVWSGRRCNVRIENADPAKLWQLPQGGIDKGETPLQAAKRELHEETGAVSVRLLYEHADWLNYDIPPQWRKSIFKGKYQGQRQKWFAFAFDGAESEFDLSAHHQPEFDEWQWRRLEDCPQNVVDFKRPLYEELVKIFAPKLADWL